MEPLMDQPTKEIPLQSLKKGATARITSLEGDSNEIARLSALGLREGVELCSLRKGCPCIVQFGCSKMCIRTAGQLKVMVAPF